MYLGLRQQNLVFWKQKLVRLDVIYESGHRLAACVVQSVSTSDLHCVKVVKVKV